MSDESKPRRSQSDGKELEELVSHIESQFLPAGLNVETRKRVFDEDGTQIAELDVLVSGVIGTTDFSWLIECRDRPSEGPAPRGWIQQLVGRRADLKVHKITAVSTTGFAKSAIKLANREGIELREVAALKPEDFSNWMKMRSFVVDKRVSSVRSVHFNVPDDLRSQVDTRLRAETINNKTLLLRSILTNETISSDEAFSRAVNEAQAHETIRPGERRKLKINVSYPLDDDHFVIDTGVGPVRVEKIDFEGEIWIEQTEVPLVAAKEYRHQGAEAISESISFVPVEMGGSAFALEFHRIPALDQTQIVLRRTKPE